jgi:hypothetical protein
MEDYVMKPWKLIGFLTVCAMLLVPLGAQADSIAPTTITFNANPAAISVFPVHKTVTISAGDPTTVQADIFFLSDTTGSMGTTIGTVRTNAAALMTATASLGNVAWGVGEYKDGNVDAFGYLLNQAVTTNQAAVQTGINAWVASGGGDLPEDNLMGIRRSTTDAASAWRAGSARILVQFGDAYGLDPASDGTTEAQATAALTSTGTKLIAVDVGAKNAAGQETRMVAAAGGAYLNNPSQADLITAVEDAIAKTFATYSTVSLKIVPLVDGLAPISIPADLSISGSFDRSIERTFDFDFDLIGCCRLFGVPSFDFDIQALVDGAIVAVEHDHWNCVPVPPSMILMGSGLLGLIGLRRFKRI